MIKLKLLYKNPLSLPPLIAMDKGFFNKNKVNVDIEPVVNLPGFHMDSVTANVGDTTRIFENINNGIDMIITSDLTRTMKLILCDDYKSKGKLKIISSPNQSLGIYTEQFMKKSGLDYELILETNLAKRVEILKSGKADGACMIDPFLIPFIGNGFNVVYEGKSNEHNYTCWAFRKEYVNKNSQAVFDFHKSINEAGAYYNNLSCDEKVKYAKKLLNFDDELDEYYSNLQFEEDKQYSNEALKTCFDWKIRKEPHLRNIKIDNIILQWSN